MTVLPSVIKTLLTEIYVFSVEDNEDATGAMVGLPDY